MKYILLSILAVSLLLSGCTLSNSLGLSSPSQEKPASRVSSPAPANNQSGTDKPADQPSAKRTLNLSGQQLVKVPDYVFKETSLEGLNLSNNKLTGAIQAEIRQLKLLKILDLSDNQLTGVPAEVGQLADLEVLDLSNNQLTGLPYELGNLSKLKVLDISGNNYAEADLAIIKSKLPATVTILK